MLVIECILPKGYEEVTINRLQRQSMSFKSESFQLILFSLDRSHRSHDGVLEKTVTHDLDMLAQPTDRARN